jgi:hypothetical protein
LRGLLFCPDEDSCDYLSSFHQTSMRPEVDDQCHWVH